LSFTIDPKAPLKDLLPAAPKSTPSGGPLLGDELTRVPEIAFEERSTTPPDAGKALERNAHTIAKINHLNRAKSDGFMEALLKARTDLAGLPFAMGDACRMKGERSREFGRALALIRALLPAEAPTIGSGTIGSGPATSGSLAPAGDPLARVSTTAQKVPPTGVVSRTFTVVSKRAPRHPSTGDPAADFWIEFRASCLEQDAETGGKQKEDVILGRVAALVQVLAVESAGLRKGLVKYLAGVSHPEATRALARLAIFSAEDEVRLAAVEALKVRRERDYTDILLQGLRYPLPAVARRAGDAVARLERTDLIEKLVDLLEEPDPRLPVMTTIKKERLPVVRELVRINHHRNCVLCHAPGNTAGISPHVVTAGIPTPGTPLSPPSGGYQSSVPQVLVRIDVTYLRQDFSLRQPVADAHPWPELQRFDFLVRTRVLTEEEAEAYRAKLTPREAGRLSPYHRAILAALRELTGRDAAPTPQAWRELLGLQETERKPRTTP
jgi:hypothetical protein